MATLESALPSGYWSRRQADMMYDAILHGQAWAGGCAGWRGKRIALYVWVRNPSPCPATSSVGQVPVDTPARYVAPIDPATVKP
jgi:hypothetical protein